MRTSFLRPRVEGFPSAREKYFFYVRELYSVLILTVQRYEKYSKLPNNFVNKILKM